MLFNIYLATCILSFLSIMSGIALILNRFSREYNKKLTFSEFIFSPSGVQCLIISVMPIFNCFMGAMFLFNQDSLYNATKKNLAKRGK